jgi:hypothetical protein
MQWATSTSTVIKCLFEVNAIFIKLRSTTWVTRWCFCHTLPTLILLTPGVHFLVNMKSVSQLSADNSNSFVCLHDASVLCLGHRKYEHEECGFSLTACLLCLCQGCPQRFSRTTVSRKVLVKGHTYSFVMHWWLKMNSISKGFLNRGARNWLKQTYCIRMNRNEKPSNDVKYFFLLKQIWRMLTPSSANDTSSSGWPPLATRVRTDKAEKHREREIKQRETELKQAYKW